MPKLPVITGREFVRYLKRLGFAPTRQKGSHVRLQADDGRVTTVPIHKGKTLPKGLLRKIIRDDLEMELEEFVISYSKNVKK